MVVQRGVLPSPAERAEGPGEGAAGRAGCFLGRHEVVLSLKLPAFRRR